MDITAVFIGYFGIKETQVQRDTAWRGQYLYPVFIAIAYRYIDKIAQTNTDKYR